MAWSQEITPSMCEHYIALWRKDLDAWEQRLKDAPRWLSAKAALRELDLMPSGRSPYVLAGIMGGNGYDVAKDADAKTVPILPGPAAGIKSIAAPQEVGAIADCGLSFARDLPSPGQSGDVATRGAISRVSRRAGELIWHAIAEDPPEPVDAIRSWDSRLLLSGRHRRAPELDPEAGLYLAELSMASV
jgi:hypothetical protein